MVTVMDIVQIGVLVLFLFHPGWGNLTITSTTFECGQPASIVCERTDGSMKGISWFENGLLTRLCTTSVCQNPTVGNYKFTADKGVWTIVIDPVEWKDNNITFTCEVQTSGDVAPLDSLTTNVSVPMDNSSTLTKIEDVTDVILKAQTNCVKPVESVDITWQCMKADQVNVVDSDCRLTALPTYTSECRDLNQTCAGPGTYRMESDVKLPAYRGNYFKLVKIKAVFTDGTTVIEKISGEVKQEVPPQITTLRDCSVIENTDFTMNCILSSGDPSTVKCTWTAPSGTISNDCYLRIPIVQRTGRGTYTCRVENSVGTDTKSFYLDILYPPEKPVLKIVDTDVTDLTANVLKDTVVTIRCSSSAKPNILSYTWESAEGSVDSQLQITDTSSPFTRTYTCTATNYMNQSCGGNGAQGSNSSSVNVHIVYPPEGQTVRFNGSDVIDTSGSISVIRGQNFTLTCSANSDPASTYRWDKRTHDGGLLSINNIGLDQSHTCTASNEIRLYNGSTVVRGSKLTVDIEVLYKTTISSLTIDDTEDRLVVNQNKANVLLKCNVSSNPLSQISLRSTTHSGSRILKQEISSDHLLYSLSTATCWDSGIYTCSGRNNVTENKVSKAVTLLVKCTARPLHKTEQNITFYRGVGDDVTLNLTLVAYPLPASELFQWSRLDKEHSTIHLNGSIVNISETSLESSLTLKQIREVDFGQYKLTIKFNDTMDAYVQDFLINAQDRPQVPENFVHLDEQLTTTTAVLKWTPGFDGGVPQVFHILYKKASDSTWSNIIVSSPHLTLTGLDPSTLYNVYMFASNALGNSSYTTTLNITTQQDESQSSNIGTLIGVAAGGGAAIVVIAAVVVVLVIFRRKAAAKSRNSSDQIGENLNPESVDDGHDGMEFNHAYVSTDTLTAAVASGSDNVYAQVDKTKKKAAANTDNTYAVVDKTSKKGDKATGQGDVYATPLKKNPGKKTDANSKQKGKKTKKVKAVKQKGRGDVYENVQEMNVCGNIGQKDDTTGENVYEKREEPPVYKRNLNKDGLIYADLAFENNNRGHTKLVIHGSEKQTDYVQVDFSKKAEPLPDSDEEGDIA